MLLPLSFQAIVDLALSEDLAAGDVTTESCIAPGAKAVAHAVARKPMVACGGAVLARVFEKIDPEHVSFEAHVEEGAFVEWGTRLWSVRGSARSILMGERTALNFVQRMCGVATIARTYVSALQQGSRTRIIDTRKTTPGHRALERYAVRCGGAHNHRDNLGSAVLIKDNHIEAAGSISAAIDRAKQNAPHTTKIECEVESLEGLDEAIAAGADIVLLDNMDTVTVKEAVARAKGRVFLEASGGITLERVRELSEAGVDAISVGALTHSAPAADIGLDFE
ncbi:MAG TPA: carboxylating nicotinate-nucleotide diphosphorylase [Polyangiaceae bacterium]|jgi:nicotinate-nucleotide pyrophosphorylase (carboxylating)